MCDVQALPMLTVEKSGRWGGSQPCLAQRASFTHSTHRSRSITSKSNSLSFIFRGEFAFYPRGRMSRRELREIYTRCSRHNIKRFFVRTNFSSTPFFVGKRKKRVSEHRSFLFCTVRSPISQPSAIDVKNGPAFLCFALVKSSSSSILLSYYWTSVDLLHHKHRLHSHHPIIHLIWCVFLHFYLSLLPELLLSVSHSRERPDDASNNTYFTLEYGTAH